MITQYILNCTHPRILPAHRTHCFGPTPLTPLMRACRRGCSTADAAAVWARAATVRNWPWGHQSRPSHFGRSLSFSLPATPPSIPSASTLTMGSRRQSRHVSGTGNLCSRGKSSPLPPRPSRFSISPRPPASSRLPPPCSSSAAFHDPWACTQRSRLLGEACGSFRWLGSPAIDRGWSAGLGNSSDFRCVFPSTLTATHR